LRIRCSCEAYVCKPRSTIVKFDESHKMMSDMKL
jgi:hypothetical protein